MRHMQIRHQEGPNVNMIVANKGGREKIFFSSKKFYDAKVVQSLLLNYKVPEGLREEQNKLKRKAWEVSISDPRLRM